MKYSIINMKFSSPATRAAEKTGQKYCEKHCKYYRGQCPDCKIKK